VGILAQNRREGEDTNKKSVADFGSTLRPSVLHFKSQMYTAERDTWLTETDLDKLVAKIQQTRQTGLGE
jgi:hypothetical protein